jgi:AcrR family transcriptional regulator
VGHRAALLAGAKRCLYEKGYARTTARDIVAASGTNLASIGYHFGSKEALLAAALIEATGEWGDALERLLAADVADGGSLAADPLGRFEATWTRVIESLATHRPLWVASFEAVAQAERSPQVREYLAEALERARFGLAEMLQGLAGAVDERGPVDERAARTVGSFYQALLSGVLVQWLIDPSRAPSGHDLAEGLRRILGSLQVSRVARGEPAGHRRGAGDGER